MTRKEFLEAFINKVCTDDLSPQARNEIASGVMNEYLELYEKLGSDVRVQEHILEENSLTYEELKTPNRSAPRRKQRSPKRLLYVSLFFLAVAGIATLVYVKSHPAEQPIKVVYVEKPVQAIVPTLPVQKPVEKPVEQPVEEVERQPEVKQAPENSLLRRMFSEDPEPKDPARIAALYDSRDQSTDCYVQSVAQGKWRVEFRSYNWVSTGIHLYGVKRLVLSCDQGGPVTVRIGSHLVQVLRGASNYYVPVPPEDQDKVVMASLESGNVRSDTYLFVTVLWR